MESLPPAKGGNRGQSSHYADSGHEEKKEGRPKWAALYGDDPNRQKETRNGT